MAEDKEKSLFEFDAPQFQDFTVNENVSEEYCQNYFDKKTDEIRRNSNEFEKIEENKNDDDNDNNEAPSNLLSKSFSDSTNHSNDHNTKQHSFMLNRSINKTNKLTTEEMELIRVNEKKQELAKIQELNAKNVRKMRESHNVFQPTRSIQLTIPISPALQTSIRAQQRMKYHNKIKRPLSVSPYRQKINNENNVNNNKENQENRKPKTKNCKKRKTSLTVPQSFKLSKTKKRRKTNSERLSTEQKTLKEIENHGNFKARKLNHKIFQSNSGNMGILNNIKNKHTTTTVKPFNFLTEKRAQKHHHLQDT